MERKYIVEEVCSACGISRPIPKYSPRGRICRSCSNKFKTRPIKDRFWEKVTVDKNGCWIWNSTIDKDGYGVFKLDRKDVKAHRVSWKLTNGNIPNGMQILHKCDNPPCVNPDHLFCGTPQDNMNDKNKKGRGIYLKGSQLSQSKLNESDVLKIRSQYKSGKATQRELADKFGVTDGNIYFIVNNKSWKHLENK